MLFLTENITKRISELLKQNLSERKIADILINEFPEECISINGWKSRVNRFNVNNPKSKNLNDPPNSVEYKDGNTVFEKIISISNDEPITPEIMLKAHNLDETVWDVVSYKNNYWSQQGKDNSIIPLYQSKIIVRPKTTPELSLKELTKYFNEHCNNNISCVPCKKHQNSSGKLLEINITDLHLGKLCWNEETGETYDISVAKDRFFEVISKDLERIRQNQFEKVIFVWCNDFFNSDGISNSTTGGTLQSTSGRWQQLFQLGCKMLVDTLEMVSEYCPVETFYIASNHARQTEFYAINYLYAWFRNNSNVLVHINCSPRYYINWGINLIDFTHSSYEKKQNLSYLMSVEKPEYWSTTKYREFHLAHYHCEKVEEKGGVVYRWLPSITGTDDWHNDCGYLGAFKRCYSFVYDKNYGLVQINNNMIQSPEIGDDI